MHGKTSRVLTTLAAAALVLTACGGRGDPAADEGGVTTVAAAKPQITTSPTTAPTAATSSTTDAPKAPPTTVDVAEPAVSDDELVTQIETVLGDAIEPGSIAWNAGGVDTPPTAAVAALRLPGRDDLFVAVGKNVDGSPAESDAPFPVGPLTDSLVRTVAFQLVDEGALDPTRTVDQWAPTLPNADRVTVQMVIDGETGWSDYGDIEPHPVINDFEHAWTLQEAVDLRATTMTALAEPGTRTDDGLTAEAVLGLIVEEVGGQPLAGLIHDRVSEPAGLDDTWLLDGRNTPPRYRHGMLAFDGTSVDTSMFPGVSYLTWNQAVSSTVSTPRDLLDLLDAWTTGVLFTTDRAPAPDRYVLDPAGNPNTYVGLGVPFNAYCPCEEVAGGIAPAAVGRSPGSAPLGTRNFIRHYSDGISMVINFNSDQAADLADLEAVVNAVHDLAAAAA